jgi:isopropylmalate/homocitrate/citramalate synthase
MRQAPYVGASAFAHKAGLHASAILKDPATYEHIDPAVVGNARIIPMSNQAGQSNLRRRLAEAGLEVTTGDPVLGRILDTVKPARNRAMPMTPRRPVSNCWRVAKWASPRFLRGQALPRHRRAAQEQV